MAKNMKAPDAPKDVKKIFSRLFSYYKDYKFLVVIAVITAIFSSAASIVGTLFLKELIDTYITPIVEKAPGAPTMGVIYVSISALRKRVPTIEAAELNIAVMTAITTKSL